MSTQRSRAGLLATAGLALALAAVILVTLAAHRAAAATDARAEALTAAKERVPALLGYDAATLDADLATAAEQTTGDFRTDYGKILDEVVKPTATQRGISTTAAVDAAGVVRGTRDRVVVLLFLTQTTTATKGEDGGKGGTSVSGSRVEVTMARDGDGWRIAGLRPV
jgi:Mce-associated membrane protein